MSETKASMVLPSKSVPAIASFTLVNISLMMLGVVDFHRPSINARLKGVVGVGQCGKRRKP